MRGHPTGSAAVVEGEPPPIVGSFTFKPLGPFSLAAVARFLEHLPSANVEHNEAGGLDLAFVSDRVWAPVGVRLTQRGTAVNGRYAGVARAEDVRRQVQRILSLDVDGRPFAALARTDDVVAALQARYPGLRPLRAWSPYEAAVWAVLADGVPLVRAAAVKARLTAELGHCVELDGSTMTAFPAPRCLLDLRQFPGLVGAQPERLRAVGAAALAGELDADRLGDLPRERALATLRRIACMGPSAAELVLTGAVGEPDAPPNLADAAFTKAVVRAYSLRPDADVAQITAIVDGWRPFRSWVSFLLRERAQAWDLPTQLSGAGRARTA